MGCIHGAGEKCSKCRAAAIAERVGRIFRTLDELRAEVIELDPTPEEIESIAELIGDGAARFTAALRGEAERIRTLRDA